MGRTATGLGLGLWISIAAWIGLLALPATAQEVVSIGAPDTQSVAAPVQLSPLDRLIGSFHYLTQNDLLRVSFYDGREAASWERIVDGNGAVTLPYVGAVQVGGMLPHEAALALQEAFLRFYKQPIVDLNVLEFGKLQVFLVGSDQPGRLVTMSNGDTLYELLDRYVYSPPVDASGTQDVRPIQHGNYRRVHLIRGARALAQGALPGPMAAGSEAASGGTLLSMAPPAAVARASDFDSFAQYSGWTPWIEQCKLDPACSVEIYDPLQAAREANPAALDVPLLPGDVVYLPVPLRSVAVYGAAQSGRFELLEEHTLAEVLRLAGSVDLQADLCNAVIERSDDCCAQTQYYVDLASGLHELDLLAGFEIEDGDTIRINPIERRIFVFGEVKLAGAFDYNYDGLVTDYLAQAGGMTPSANTGWLAIIRQNRDRRYPGEAPEVIQVNFKEIYKGHELVRDFRLLKGDTIYVPPKGASFSFQQVISSLTSGFAIFQVLDDSGSSSSNGSGTGNGTSGN